MLNMDQMKLNHKLGYELGMMDNLGLLFIHLLQRHLPRLGLFDTSNYYLMVHIQMIMDFQMSLSRLGQQGTSKNLHCRVSLMKILTDIVKQVRLNANTFVFIYDYSIYYFLYLMLILFI